MQIKKKWSKQKGKRFGKLKVIGLSESGAVLCQCSCGNKKEIASHNLNNTKSCGCLRSGRPAVHGLTGTRTYMAWNNAVKRGAALQWNNSFNNFLEDMGETPHNHVLRRRNPELPYSKSNCYWDIKGPLRYRNKRVLHPDDPALKKFSLATLHGRFRRGYSVEEATEIPKGKHVKKWRGAG